MGINYGTHDAELTDEDLAKAAGGAVEETDITGIVLSVATGVTVTASVTEAVLSLAGAMV